MKYNKYSYKLRNEIICSVKIRKYVTLWCNYFVIGTKKALIINYEGLQKIFVKAY